MPYAPMSPDCPAARAAASREEHRLLWQCRRGMRELDVLLERFARSALPEAPQHERRSFEALLALSDPELAGYLLGGQTHPEPQLAQLLDRIRGLCRSGT